MQGQNEGKGGLRRCLSSIRGDHLPGSFQGPRPTPGNVANTKRYVLEERRLGKVQPPYIQLSSSCPSSLGSRVQTVSLNRVFIVINRVVVPCRSS